SSDLGPHRREGEGVEAGRKGWRRAAALDQAGVRVRLRRRGLDVPRTARGDDGGVAAQAEAARARGDERSPAERVGLDLMDCPACGTSNSRVLDTFKGVEDKRKRECPCGARWSSTETIDKGSLRVATGTDQSPPVSTNGKRSRRVTPNRGIPQPLGANDAGGVGGDLRSGSDSIPFLADQDPSLKTPQQVDPARVWTPGDWLR